MEGLRPVCVHLRPALEYLQSLGAQLTGCASRAWSQTDLELCFDRGPRAETLPAGLRDSPDLRVWHNRDPHDPIAQGLACQRCHHALSWPLELPQGGCRP